MQLEGFKGSRIQGFKCNNNQPQADGRQQEFSTWTLDPLNPGILNIRYGKMDSFRFNYNYNESEYDP